MKFFRIAKSGATCDGRTITKEWITQMATNYNPKVYGARVNLEHIRGILPDGEFKRLGDVIALKTEQEGDDLYLLAAIEPTEELKKMVKAKQKIYTSIEVNSKFADTNEAYLVGLAVTDDPASLGTEMLSFCANASVNPLNKRKQNISNSISECIETDFSFTSEEPTNWYQKLMTMFTKESQKTDFSINEVKEIIELAAQKISSQEEAIKNQGASYNTLNTKVESLATDLSKLSSTLETSVNRPEATGGNIEQPIITEC